MYEIVLAASAIIAVVAFFVLFNRPSFNLYNPAFYYYIFHVIIFVIRPIVAYLQTFDGVYIAYGFNPSMADKATVLVAANVGFIAFTFFCMQQGDVPMEFRRDAVDEEEKRLLTQIFVWAWAICGPIALYSVITSVSSFISGEYIQGLVLDRGTGAFINTSSNGYFTDSQFMFGTLCAVLAWLGRFRIYSLVPLIVFVGYRAWTGSRGGFVYALVMLALFFAYDRKIRLPTPTILALILVVVSLFRFVGDDRGESIRQAIGTEAKEQILTGDRRAKLRTLESMDYGNMEFFEYLVYVVPQRSGTYDYFLDNFQVLTEPIPRVLWSGKPIGEPFRRIFLFNYGFPIGMTRSLPGEGWYALGWAGVIIWCGFWGGLLGRLYRRFAQGRQTTMEVVFYIVFLPTLITFYRDGQLLTFTKEAGVFLAPVAVWYVAARISLVPRIADLRLQLQSRRRAAASPPPTARIDNPAETAVQPSSSASGAEPTDARRKSARWAAQMLPPAVRRRREALGRLPGPLSDPATRG